MSSYVGLYVKDKELFTYCNGVDPEMLDLFLVDDLLHLTGTKATKYATSWDIENMSPEEIEGLEIFVCATPAGVLKDRLNVMGFGEALVKEAFEEALKKDIELIITFPQRHSNKSYGKNVEERLEEHLKELQTLDYDTWMQQLDAYILSKRYKEKTEAGSSSTRGLLKF